MKKSKSMKIIERIAAENGVSTAEVRRDMSEAIDIAYKNRKPTEVFWHKWRGRKPSPDEFILAASSDILARLNFGNSKQ